MLSTVDSVESRRDSYMPTFLSGLSFKGFETLKIRVIAAFEIMAVFDHCTVPQFDVPSPGEPSRISQKYLQNLY